MERYEVILQKVVESIKKSNTFRTKDDLELKQLLVSYFFCFLLEDELLQAEYRVDDIALIVLLFWDNQNSEYSEHRIREVLYEPIRNNYFVHYGKIIRRDESYEFVLRAITQALKNNFTLEASLRNLHDKAYAAMDLCPQLPMEERNRFGLLSAIDLLCPLKDPALRLTPSLMN